MTISSSMNAGIMGLAVNATRLATISDNIANSDTYGYKRAVAEFQSMVIQQRDNTYAAGGVRVDSFRQVDEQGSLISTGNSTDIAIAGRGLLAVTNQAGAQAEAAERPLKLTATGSFSPDENGFLRTASGLFLMGWPTDANGELGAISRQSGASLEPVNVQVNRFTATATQNISMGINLPADATEAGGTGDPFEIPLEYFDNLGRTQVIDASFSPRVPIPPSTAATNTWDVVLTDNASGTPTTAATFTVTFNDDPVTGGTVASVTGGGYDPATGEITATLASGDTISVDVGRIGQPEGLSQLATDFAPYALTKDGAPVGDLTAIEVDAQGNLDAIYDTGFRRTLYRIPVADVPNLNGLAPDNAQAFRLSQASGDVYFWDAGTGPVGEMVGYGLMESSVDIANELTGLIETQRAYASNAKIIQTVDEMLQETTNIKR